MSGPDTSVIMRDTDFIENIARRGSAIYIDESEVVIVSGNIKYNGESENPGEAIFCLDCTLRFPQPDQVLIFGNRSCDFSWRCKCSDQSSTTSQETPTLTVLKM